MWWSCTGNHRLLYIFLEFSKQTIKTCKWAWLYHFPLKIKYWFFDLFSLLFLLIFAHVFPSLPWSHKLDLTTSSMLNTSGEEKMLTLLLIGEETHSVFHCEEQCWLKRFFNMCALCHPECSPTSYTLKSFRNLNIHEFCFLILLNFSLLSWGIPLPALL